MSYESLTTPITYISYVLYSITGLKTAELRLATYCHRFFHIQSLQMGLYACAHYTTLIYIARTFIQISGDRWVGRRYDNVKSLHHAYICLSFTSNVLYLFILCMSHILLEDDKCGSKA